MSDPTVSSVPTRVPSYEQVLGCIRCGLCLPVCPTYRELGTETDSPRGRLALIRAAAEGMLEPGRNFAEHIDRCLGCMACGSVCPSGVHPEDLIADARVEMRGRTGRSRLDRWILERVLPSPCGLEAAIWPLRLYQRTGLGRIAERDGLLRWLPYGLSKAVKLPPTVPLSPLRGSIPEVTPAVGARKHRVAFFLGCAQSLLFAKVSAATVRVLARNGVEVVTPRDARCCGMPALAHGDLETATKLARHNVEVFAGLDVEAIVTDCATCGSFGKHYDTLLKQDVEYTEKATAYSAKVVDVSAFLSRIELDDRLGEVRASVTYHDPCHLSRAQGVSAEPRRLLGMIPGIELVEMKEASWCCGGAGTYAIGHHETSMGILDRKMENAAATGASTIASGCPSCRMQLGYGVRRAGLAMEVVHPIELLDRAYRRAEECSPRRPEEHEA